MRCHRKSREMRNIGCHFQWPSSLWQPGQCWVTVSHSSGAVKITNNAHSTISGWRILKIFQVYLEIEHICISSSCSLNLLNLRAIYIILFRKFLVNCLLAHFPRPNLYYKCLKVWMENWFLFFFFVTLRRECDLMLLKHFSFLLVASLAASYLSK